MNLFQCWLWRRRVAREIRELRSTLAVTPPVDDDDRDGWEVTLRMYEEIILDEDWPAHTSRTWHRELVALRRRYIDGAPPPATNHEELGHYIIHVVTRQGTGELIVPPGTRLRRVLGFVFSRKTMEAVFDSTIADMQREWLDAEIAGRLGHARWIRIRGYLEILRALLVLAPTSLARLVVTIWKASQ